MFVNHENKREINRILSKSRQKGLHNASISFDINSFLAGQSSLFGETWNLEDVSIEESSRWNQSGRESVTSDTKKF